jgi:hypothetical protein
MKMAGYQKIILAFVIYTIAILGVFYLLRYVVK